MGREESFDSFYRATRRPVLHQALALTGDLPAAQSAVRDAYVGAWQHWRKVSRLEDPLDWVRPRAWQLAQRRHTARIWRRNKGLAEQHKAVLDALASLPVAQRRVLLLVDLAGLEPAHAARELGVTREVAEQNHRVAAEALAARLGVDPATAQLRVEALDALLEHASLPRGPIIRRAGRKRRQVHALVGTAVAAAVALGVGGAGLPADRQRRRGAPAGEAPAPATAAKQPADDGPDRREPPRPRPDPPARPGPAVAGHPHRRQHLRRRHQHDLPADPVRRPGRRTPRSCGPSPPGAGAQRSAVQTVEVSKSVRQAGRGFRTTVGWYAGCRVGRLQVLNSYRVDNIGDEADVLTAAAVEEAGHHAVGRGRPHRQDHHLDGRQHRRRQPSAGLADHPVARGLGRDAVRAERVRATARSGRPTASYLRRRPARSRGILAVADLPPVGRIARPWVGTKPVPARRNPSATTCDRADFAKAGATTTRTRTYLIPEASLPVRFGLSETYGRFRTPAAASRFLADVRRSVARCEDRDLATQVSGERRERTGRRSSTCPAGTCRPRSATSRRCGSGSASCGSAARSRSSRSPRHPATT